MGSIKSKTRTFAGRFANRFVPDNPTSDTAVQSTIKTTKTIVKAKKTYTNVKMTLLNTEKVIQAIIGKLNTAPIVKIVVIVAVLFFLFMNIQKGMTMIMSFSGVFAEEKAVNSYKIEIEKLEREFIKGLEKYKKPDFDEYRIEYTNGFSEFKINRKEILCYMLVMFGQNLKCNEEEKTALKEIFAKLTEVKITTVNEKSKNIQVTQVTVKSIADIIDTLGWSDDEKELYYMFMENNLEEIFPDFIDDYDFYIGGQTKEILDSLQNEPATRERLIKTALSLVGKVGYFWGGRSSPGFNSEWGKMKMVTAPGNKNTGTYQPYGLDCSGYTSWVYCTAGFGNAISGGSTLQWQQSYAITESELRPGDLVFKQSPTAKGVNHVGIYYKTENGKKLFIHCSSSKGVVVNSYNAFKYWRRALVKFDGE